jgi:hypothetical protein
MRSFLSFAVTIIIFVLLFAAYWLWANRAARREGAVPMSPRPPKPESRPQPTMFDVRRLLKEGDKRGATRLYAKIFKMPAAQASKDIDELERSLKS